jgi:hypothetical protein
MQTETRAQPIIHISPGRIYSVGRRFEIRLSSMPDVDGLAVFSLKVASESFMVFVSVSPDWRSNANPHLSAPGFSAGPISRALDRHEISRAFLERIMRYLIRSNIVDPKVWYA